jgi:hypothetical protein
MERDPNRLRVSEIRRILETCRDLGVVEVEIYGIKAKFSNAHGNEQPDKTNSQLLVQNIPGTKEIEPPTLLTELDREVLEDMKRSQLLLDDPLAFEQVMISDHLARPGALLGAEA